jgi:hypothetical protein
MATTSTSTFTAQTGSGGGTPSAQAAYPNPRTVGGKLRLAQIPYQLVSSSLPAAGDIIQLGKLPVGSRVIAALSSIQCPDPGTTLTLKVGDYSNANRYAGIRGTLAGLVLSAASSTVGSGLVGFGLVPGSELIYPNDIVQSPRALPVPWVTGTAYQIGQQVTVAALTYTCLQAHTAGVHATDLTALKWVLSGNYQSWIPSTAYVIGDTFTVNGATSTAAAVPTANAISYIVTTGHTSDASFAVDLAAGRVVATNSDETTLIATVTSSGTLTAGTTILFNIAYISE